MRLFNFAVYYIFTSMSNLGPATSDCSAPVCTSGCKSRSPTGKFTKTSEIRGTNAGVYSGCINYQLFSLFN